MLTYCCTVGICCICLLACFGLETELMQVLETKPHVTTVNPPPNNKLQNEGKIVSRATVHWVCYCRWPLSNSFTLHVVTLLLLKERKKIKGAFNKIWKNMWSAKLVNMQNNCAIITWSCQKQHCCYYWLWTLSLSWNEGVEAHFCTHESFLSLAGFLHQNRYLANLTKKRKKGERARERGVSVCNSNNCTLFLCICVQYLVAGHRCHCHCQSWSCCAGCVAFSSAWLVTAEAAGEDQ